MLQQQAREQEFLAREQELPARGQELPQRRGQELPARGQERALQQERQELALRQLLVPELQVSVPPERQGLSALVRESQLRK